MNIAVVFDHADHHPWSAPGPWSVAISRGLASLGHTVHVLCDASTLTEPYDAPGVSLEQRRPGRRTIQARPLALAAWLRRRTRELDIDRTISLTWVYPGGSAHDLWLPMDRSMRALAERIWKGRSLPSMALQTLTRPWLPTMAYRHWQSSRGVKNAPLWLGRDLPAASLLPVPSASDRQELRGRTRSLLKIEPETRVLLLSAMASPGPAFKAFIAALAKAPKMELIVTDGSPHRFAAAAQAAGCAERVIPIGTTTRDDALLAACDAVVDLMHMQTGHAAGPRRHTAYAAAQGVPVLRENSSWDRTLSGPWPPPPDTAATLDDFIQAIASRLGADTTE